MAHPDAIWLTAALSSIIGSSFSKAAFSPKTELSKALQELPGTPCFKILPQIGQYKSPLCYSLVVILPCGGTKLVFNFLYATDISRLKKKELEAYISLSWKTQDLTRAPFTFSCRIELNFILSSCSRGPVLTSAFLFKPPSMYLIFNSRSLIAVFFFLSQPKNGRYTADRRHKSGFCQLSNTSSAKSAFFIFQFSQDF